MTYYERVFRTAESPKLEFQEKNHFCPSVVTEEQEFLIEVLDNTHQLYQALGSQHLNLK